MNINLTIIGQMISFAIFVWFCAKYIWPPIINAMAERESKIADGLAAADRAMRRLREYLDAAIATRDDPLEQIAGAIEAFLGFFDEHPEFAELLIQERALFRDRNKPTYIEHREKNVGRWQQLYQALIEAGRVRAMPVHRITSVISDLVYGTMFTNHVAGRQKALREQADDIVDIVFCGILSDSERRRWEGNR